MRKTGPMSLYECECLAKDVGFDSMKFTAMFPIGPKVCRWLDAYFGMFVVDDLGNSFLTVRDVHEMYPDLVCIPEVNREAA